MSLFKTAIVAILSYRHCSECSALFRLKLFSTLDSKLINAIIYKLGLCINQERQIFNKYNPQNP